MNDVCRFSRDYVVERSCVEPVYVGDVSGDPSPNKLLSISRINER